MPVSLLVKNTPSRVFDTPLVCENQPCAKSVSVENTDAAMNRTRRKRVLFISIVQRVEDILLRLLQDSGGGGIFIVRAGG
jgi:hypothetical protein